MEILEVNTNTLAVLFDGCPEAFEGITLEGNYLLYDGEKIDISEFNINDLISNDNSFAASLHSLKPEDVFRIIRLHVNLLGNRNNNTYGPHMSDDLTNEKIEVFKQRNPLMRNISVVKKNDGGIKREYINIVDSSGKDHLFPNDRNVNIFDIYDLLKIKYGKDVTPDQLIEAVYRKLYDVRLSTAENLMDKSSTSEEFAHKLERVNAPYRDSKTVNVVASEEHDIAVVSDTTDASKHQVVTFEQNQFGDLVLNHHDQNVIGNETISRNNTQSTVVQGENDVDETIASSQEILEKDEEEVTAIVITTQEFYDLLNSPNSLSEEELASVNLYYAYLGDLIKYEEYLVPELKKMLQDFRAYVYELEYGDVHVPLNEKQREATAKLKEMEESKKTLEESVTQEKINDGVKKLQRVMPADNYVAKENEDNAGMVSVIQVVAFIIGISIILTAVTLYLIS